MPVKGCIHVPLQLIELSFPAASLRKSSAQDIDDDIFQYARLLSVVLPPPRAVCLVVTCRVTDIGFQNTGGSSVQFCLDNVELTGTGSSSSAGRRMLALETMLN